MKKPLALASALTLILATAGCSTEDPDDPITLTVAGVWDAQHPMSRAMDEVFTTKVEEESGGAIEIEMYHGGTLGNEQNIWDSVRNGGIDAAVIGSSMNQEFPTMLISDWPFLYDDVEHARDVWTSPLADELSEQFHEQFPSTYLLGWGPNSARIFSSNEPLESVDDFQGQRFRMPSNPIHIGIAQNLGANPQFISLGDLFTALETGIVNGQDNGLVTLRSQALYEVQDYIYETNHIVATMHVILNADFLDGLDPQLRSIVEDAAQEASAVAWDSYLESIEEDRRVLEDAGLVFTELSESEREKMIDRLQPLYDDLYAEHEWAEELVQQIEEMGS